MSKYTDPLGFDSIISQIKTLHDLNPLEEDQIQQWNTHPVTQRLKQLLAIDLHARMTQAMTPISAETKSVYENIIDDSFIGGNHANN